MRLRFAACLAFPSIIALACSHRKILDRTDAVPAIETDAATDAMVMPGPDAQPDAAPEACLTMNSDAGDAGDAGTVEPYDASALRCPPRDVSAYTGPIYRAPHKQAGRCTDLQISVYLACRSSSDAESANCKAAKMPEFANCTSCLESSGQDANWGPLVFLTANAAINYAGCLDIISAQCGQTMCGQALAGYSGCLNAACGSCETQETLGECAVAAEVNGCRPYADALVKACSTFPPNLLNTCKNFNADFLSFARLFCGP